MGGVRGAAVVGGATIVAGALLLWGLAVFGPSSVVFAVLVVWLPMAWLGTISRIIRPRLPARYHALRPCEADGRLYERLGVRIAKRLLRRGPLARFNPDLHLPTEATAETVAHLEQRMRDAEAAHMILFIATLGIVVHAVARRWWAAAAVTLLSDIVLNGYPVMLQRYNRALLTRFWQAKSAP